jgi:hypothetical protein
MKLAYRKNSDQARAWIVPDDYIIPYPDISILATKVEEAREGYTYLVPITSQGSEIIKGIVKYRDGALVNVLGKQESATLFSGKPLLEFPHHKIVHLETEVPDLAKLIETMPENTSLIRMLMRKHGIPLPPIGFVENWLQGDWLKWITEAEMPLEPKAVEFLRKLSLGQVEYYDEVSSFSSRLPSAPPPRRPAEPEIGGTLQIRATRTERGNENYTTTSRYRGEVRIPRSVLEEGEDVVREFVDEFVADLDWDDFDDADTDHYDTSCDNVETEVDRYGDIEELVRQFEETREAEAR